MRWRWDCRHFHIWDESLRDLTTTAPIKTLITYVCMPATASTTMVVVAQGVHRCWQDIGTTNDVHTRPASERSRLGTPIDGLMLHNFDSLHDSWTAVRLLEQHSLSRQFKDCVVYAIKGHLAKQNRQWFGQVIRSFCSCLVIHSRCLYTNSGGDCRLRKMPAHWQGLYVSRIKAASHTSPYFIAEILSSTSVDHISASGRLV